MPTFLFRDEFSTPETAPITAPRTAEPGPGSWDVTQTNNRLSITGAGPTQVIASGADLVWNDPALWTAAALNGTNVGAILLVIRPRGHAKHIGAFLAESQAPTNPHLNSFGVRMAAGSLEAIGPQLTVPNLAEPNGTPVYIGIPGAHIRSINYGVVLIPRTGGGYWMLVSGGAYGTFPDARRSWIGNTEDWAENLWLGVTGDSAPDGSTFEVSSVRVIDKADIPAQWNDRLFTAISGDEFGGSGGLNNRAVEIGTETWALADSSVDGTISGGDLTNTGNFFGYINRATNDQVAEFTWTQGAVDDSDANRFIGLIIRGTGTAQSAFHRIAWFANNNEWGHWNGSTWFGWGVNGVPPVIGQTYTMRLYDRGTLINVYILNHATGAWTRIRNDYSISSAGTRVGMYSGTNDRSTIHEFAVWERERTVELPAGLGPVPPVAEIGDTVYQSAFEVGSNQSLAGFETDALNPSGWQVDEDWSGGSIDFVLDAATNTVQISQAIPSNTFRMVGSRDVGTADHSAETVIHLNSPATQNYMVGVAVRYGDINNWIIARYLEQGAGADLGNEIEVWQKTGPGTETLMPMVNLRTLYQAGDTCRMRVAAVDDQLYVWHATGGANPLELVAQGHINSSLMTQTRCGLGLDALTGFGGGDPQWDSVTLAEASVAAEDPADIVWTAPAADSTLSGIVDLVTETEDNRVTTVQYRIGDTVLGTTGPDE